MPRALTKVLTATLVLHGAVLVLPGFLFCWGLSDYPVLLLEFIERPGERHSLIVLGWSRVLLLLLVALAYSVVLVASVRHSRVIPGEEVVIGALFLVTCAILTVLFWPELVMVVPDPSRDWPHPFDAAIRHLWHQFPREDGVRIAAAGLQTVLAVALLRIVPVRNRMPAVRPSRGD